MNLLGGQQREALLKIESHLVSECGDGSGAGPVFLSDSCIKYVPEQLLVLYHVFEECFTLRSNGVAGRRFRFI